MFTKEQDKQFEKTKEIEDKYVPVFMNFISDKFKTKKIRRVNSETDLTGRDFEAKLETEQIIKLECKVRPDKDYNDIFLEFISNSKSGSLGWVCKPQSSDYIIYYIAPTEKFYIFPTLLLQLAWKENSEKWKEEYGKVPVKNADYTTWGCPVPACVIYKAMLFTNNGE